MAIESFAHLLFFSVSLSFPSFRLHPLLLLRHLSLLLLLYHHLSLVVVRVEIAILVVRKVFVRFGGKLRVMMVRLIDAAATVDDDDDDDEDDDDDDDDDDERRAIW